jgi:hypothetical protein
LSPGQAAQDGVAVAVDGGAVAVDGGAEVVGRAAAALARSARRTAWDDATLVNLRPRATITALRLCSVSMSFDPGT